VLLNVAAPVAVKEVNVELPDAVNVDKVVAPVTPKVPPTFTFPTIPAPPPTCKAPVVVEVDAVILGKFKSPLIVALVMEVFPITAVFDPLPFEFEPITISLVELVVLDKAIVPIKILLVLLVRYPEEVPCGPVVALLYAPAELPMAIFEFPVVILDKAFDPILVFSAAVIALSIELFPIDIFLSVSPAVAETKYLNEELPNAMLFDPIVLADKTLLPIPILLNPLVNAYNVV
jgi:hypothetical protein